MHTENVMEDEACPTCNGPAAHPFAPMRRHPALGNPDTPENCKLVYDRLVAERDANPENRLIAALVEGWRLPSRVESRDG